MLIYFRQFLPASYVFLPAPLQCYAKTKLSLLFFKNPKMLLIPKNPKTHFHFLLLSAAATPSPDLHSVRRHSRIPHLFML